MKQKTKFKNFGNISYRLSVHEWPIYWYRPHKICISRSLMLTGKCRKAKTRESKQTEVVAIAQW